MPKPSQQPIAFTEKYRARNFDEFVGIKKPRAIMQAFCRRPYPSAFLLIGPSGTGKTTLALAAIENIGGELHHIPSQRADVETIRRTVEQCHYTPMFGNGSNWHHILMDEADRMSKAGQLALLSVLDCTAPPPSTIFWFTSNGDNENLEDRFLSRCKVVKFTTDDMEDEAIALLKRIWRKEAPAKSAAPDFAAMLRESRMNIREAIGLLEMEVLAPGTFEPTIPAAAEQYAGRIFAAGYDGMKPADLKELVAKLRIDTVLDCRINPQTQYVGFSGEALQRIYGDKYQWLGETLGKNRVTEAALGWLTSRMEDGGRVLLLSREKRAGSSHRYNDIALQLLAKGVDCWHITEDEMVSTSALKKAIEENRGYAPIMWRIAKVA